MMNSTHKKDSALICLTMVAQLLDIPADAEQLRRAFAPGPQPMNKLELLRAAKGIGLKAALKKPDRGKIPLLPIPSIAILADGTFAVLGRSEGEKIVVFNPFNGQSSSVPLDDFQIMWSGEIILLTRRFSLKEAGRRFNLGWFIPAFFRYKRLFLEVIAASFFLQLFGLASPLFTQVIIDKVLVHKGVSTLNILGLGLLVVAFFEGWLSILRTYIFAHTTNKIDVLLGTRLFHHLVALPLRYFELRRVGDTVARVRELENIRQFFTGSALTVLLDTFFTVVFFGVMFYYSSALSVVVLLFLPVYAVLSLGVTPAYRRQIQERFEAGAESHSFLVETVTGIQTVKSLAVEGQFRKRWEEVLAHYVKVSFDSANLASIAGSAGQFIQRGSTLAILWYGAHLVMNGELSVGQLIAFQMLAGQVNTPVLRLVNLWQSFQQTRVSVERLGDILNAPAEQAFNPNRTSLPDMVGDVFLDKIEFRYRPEGANVLNQVSIHIPPGKRIGIVGRSGSGKSTLVKLVQRLYFPSGGRILIDGVDLAQVDPLWLRKQIGVVPQECFLFNGSIRENIAVTRPNASIQEVVEISKVAGAHEFIAALPEGYDTNVGERGTALSGGQKQRVAIARALLTNPRLLIFDEATSSLDTESESLIMKNMDRICQGRTVLIIAHRLSTVRTCDNILVLDEGRLVEQGAHEELINLRGLYYHLFTQQEG
jgi:subfamily B ATP-binding cassette protein HlyB/CyaB